MLNVTSAQLENQPLLKDPPIFLIVKVVDPEDTMRTGWEGFVQPVFLENTIPT